MFIEIIDYGPDWQQIQKWKKNIKQSETLYESKYDSRDKDEQKTVGKQAKQNPKIFWKYVRRKAVTKGEIGEIKINDTTGSVTTVVNDAHKANTFSD